MPEFIEIQGPLLPEINGEINLPLSKSECNRALMLQAWSNGMVQVDGISLAADSLLLSKLLSNQKADEFDARDSGTAFRFMTSYLALKGRHCVLTGTPRMKLRPIALLVEALREIGCRINYVEEQGFPPLEFLGFEYSGKNQLEIDASSSSQFISSLIMAAPSLPEGLEITLTGEISSSPYIFLTIGMMQSCGIEIQVIGNRIIISRQKWNVTILKPEADWSAASYWYGILANQKSHTRYFLPGLKLSSLQGDKVIADLAKFWNVATEEKENGILITKTSDSDSEMEFNFDFSDCPDLALTIIVLCAATGTRAKLSGLASLKIKESDRLFSIATELRKVGLDVLVQENGKECQLLGKEMVWPQKMVVFETYEDHRIAMALSILLASGNQSATFLHPEVVNKSYPGFWEDLFKAGFKVC